MKILLILVCILIIALFIAGAIVNYFQTRNSSNRINPPKWPMALSLFFFLFFPSIVFAAPYDSISSSSNCVEATINTTPDNQVMLMIYQSDPVTATNQNGYKCFWAGGTLYIGYDGGNWGASVSDSLSPSDVIKCIYDDGYVKAYRNDVLKTQMSLSNYSSGSYIGSYVDVSTLSNTSVCGSTPTPTSMPTPTTEPTPTPTDVPLPTPTTDPTITPTPTQSIPVYTTIYDFTTADKSNFLLDSGLISFPTSSTGQEVGSDGIIFNSGLFDHNLYLNKYSTISSKMSFTISADIPRQDLYLGFITQGLPTAGFGFGFSLTDGTYSFPYCVDWDYCDTGIAGSDLREFDLTGFHDYTFDFIYFKDDALGGNIYKTYVYMDGQLLGRFFSSSNGFLTLSKNFQLYIDSPDSPVTVSKITILQNGVSYSDFSADSELSLDGVCVLPRPFSITNLNIGSWLGYYWCRLKEMLISVAKFLFIPSSTKIGEGMNDTYDYMIQNKVPWVYGYLIFDHDWSMNSEQEVSDLGVIKIYYKGNDYTFISQDKWQDIADSANKFRPLMNIAIGIWLLIYVLKLFLSK